MTGGVLETGRVEVTGSGTKALAEAADLAGTPFQVRPVAFDAGA